MSSKQISLILQPLPSGESTQIRIEGPLPTHRPREICRVIAILARLSGQPIRAALCAADAGEWSKTWARNLSDVPKHHLELDRCSTPGVADADDRQLPLFGVER